MGIIAVFKAYYTNIKQFLCIICELYNNFRIPELQKSHVTYRSIKALSPLPRIQLLFQERAKMRLVLRYKTSVFRVDNTLRPEVRFRGAVRAVFAAKCRRDFEKSPKIRKV